MTIELTEKGIKTFNAIKGMSGDFTAAELAKKMGLPSPMSVMSHLTALVKAKALTKNKTVVENKNNKSGKSSITKFTLTAEGKAATVTQKA